jgi:hypothetical protein
MPRKERFPGNDWPNHLALPHRRPMIFTTNKPLNEWGKVLHDGEVAAAILERVLERGRFIHLDGPSGRTRHLNLEEALIPKEERLKISGISGSEFPEPTSGGDSCTNGVGECSLSDTTTFTSSLPSNSVFSISGAWTLTTTPEPSSLVLLGMGFLGMVGVRRWKKLRQNP